MGDEIARPRRRLEQITAHLPGEMIDRVWDAAIRLKINKSEVFRRALEIGLREIFNETTAR